MRVGLEFKNSQGKDVRYAVSSTQSVTIGSSKAADLCVFDTHEVFARHCEIAVSQDECTIRDLTGGKGSILVSGEPQIQAVLNDGDVVQLGRNSIRVRIRQDAERTGESIEVETIRPSDRIAASAIPIINRLKNGAGIFSVPSSELWAVVFEKWLSTKPCFLAINFRAVGVDPKAEQAVDLISDFPAEIRASDSLSFIGPLKGADCIDRLQKSERSDNSFLLVPTNAEITHEEMVALTKLSWGWMLRPSTFEFHLVNGSESLLQTLFEGIESTLFYSPSRATWLVTTLSADVVTWKDMVSGMSAKTEPADGPRASQPI
jgi:pSer/pThr/pTyr-binding forkhead associated (FHA) protein